MTNNDMLRRIRYTFDFSDQTMIDIFAQAEHQVSKEQVDNWLMLNNETQSEDASDTELAFFLNGLINFKRGKREGEPAKVETKLNNNMIFQKLRIALNFKAEDVLAIFTSVDISLTKHELSAFFRKPDNRHYRACPDQTLIQFLLGVQRQLRPDSEDFA